MTTKLTLAELESSTDRDLGTSEWETIDQRQIDLFAEATHDHQWIHVDPEAAAQGPFGTTVAHGYLTLSMLPYFVSQVLNVTDARMGINYGTEKIRFTAPVPVGSQVRLKATLRDSERRGEGVLYRLGIEVEIKDSAEARAGRRGALPRVLANPQPPSTGSEPVEGFGVSSTRSRRLYPRAAEVPFDSDYKFMATFHELEEDGRKVVAAS